MSFVIFSAIHLYKDTFTHLYIHMCFLMCHSVCFTYFSICVFMPTSIFICALMCFIYVFTWAEMCFPLCHYLKFQITQCTGLSQSVCVCVFIVPFAFGGFLFYLFIQNCLEINLYFINSFVFRVFREVMIYWALMLIVTNSTHQVSIHFVQGSMTGFLHFVYFSDMI